MFSNPTFDPKKFFLTLLSSPYKSVAGIVENFKYLALFLALFLKLRLNNFSQFYKNLVFGTFFRF